MTYQKASKSYKRAQARCRKAWLKFLEYGSDSTHMKWLKASGTESDAYDLLLTTFADKVLQNVA